MSRPSLAADLIWGAIAGAAAVWTMDKIDHLIADQERRTHNADARMAGARYVPLQIGGRTANPRIDYSVATIATAVFAALRARIPYIGAARGIPFGAAMFVLEDEVLNPRKHRNSANPAHAHATGLLTHAGFGLLVDTLLRGLRGR